MSCCSSTPTQRRKVRGNPLPLHRESPHPLFFRQRSGYTFNFQVNVKLNAQVLKIHKHSNNSSFYGLFPFSYVRLSTDICPHSCTLNVIYHSFTACVTGLLIHMSLSCVDSVRPADNNVSTPTFFPLDSLQKKLKDLEEENKSLRSEVERNNRQMQKYSTK